ncbi:hypothetical protein OAU13_00700 [bacterium]|nr:hypothetical protein [bacterium]
MSNLVLFTNRSGSTFLADILAYNDKSINLGEGLHSIARDYNYNAEGNRDTDLYKDFSKESITRRFHSMETRGSDYIGFFKAKQKRIQLLEHTDQQWTVKENLEKLTIDWRFIHNCTAEGVNVYLTHRRDIEAQFISKINARYRLEIAKQEGDSQFIYTNNSMHEEYDEMRINFRWLHMYVNVFLEQLMLWRIVYETCPDINIVSYEDEIKPMRLERLGISKGTVENYKSEQQHLVPTPHNTNKVVVVDDHPKPMRGAWEQALYYINHHKHLVEI